MGIGLDRADNHTASASLLVSPLEGNPFYPSGRGDDLINLETEAQVVASDPVAKKVSEALGESDAPATLLSGLDVSVPANTQILTIDYTADSDATAARRAQGFADAYLAFRSERAAADTSTRSKRIQGQIDSQNRDLATLVARQGQAASLAKRNLLNQQIAAVAAQIGQLRAQLAQLRTGAVDPGQVITPATIVGGGTARVVVLYGAFGLLLGLVLALSVVGIRSRAENRIHHVDDVKASGLPLLGSVTMTELTFTNSRLAELPDVEEFTTPAGLQSLRVAVLSRERRRPLRLLYSTANENTERPRSALGLAYAIAASNVNTVLVDATGESSDISAQLELGPKPGFTDVLARHVDVEGALVPVTKHFWVLPSGNQEERTDDLLTGPRVAELFSLLDGLADVVVVATGPRRGPRAQALAMFTDVSIVEAVEAEARLNDLMLIADDATASSSVIGVVFVSTAVRKKRT